MRLRDKVALISGAAGGMGRAAGGQAHYLHLDVTDEGSWSTAIDEVLDLFGRLDVLVNNAGISGTFDPDLSSTRFFDQLMLVNAKGVFLGIKHGAAAMARTGGGSVVNLRCTTPTPGSGSTRSRRGYSHSSTGADETGR